MKHPIHIEIEATIPHYRENRKKTCKKKIQEIMSKYEYDEDFTNSINDDFCQGFETARDIIIEYLKEKYWNEYQEQSENK